MNDYLLYITLIILLFIPNNRNKKILKNNFDIGTLLNPEITSLIDKLQYLKSLTRFDSIPLSLDNIITSLNNIDKLTLYNAYDILTGLDLDKMIQLLNGMLNYNYKMNTTQIIKTINDIINILNYILNYIPQLTH